jgi:hypothetical protein
MGKLENLKSYKPGQSGNPKGKPKGTKNRATALKRFMDLSAKIINPENSKSMDGTIEEKIAAAQIKKALEGDTTAFREIMDSLYGKIPQKQDIDHTTGGDKIEGKTTIVFSGGLNGKSDNKQ